MKEQILFLLLILFLSSSILNRPDNKGKSIFIENTIDSESGYNFISFPRDTYVIRINNSDDFEIKASDHNRHNKTMENIEKIDSRIFDEELKYTINTLVYTHPENNFSREAIPKTSLEVSCNKQHDFPKKE